jgi:adenylate cyclase
MIAFGLGGVLLGIAVAFFFSMGVSRPLQALVKGTRHIEAGDYLYRMPIRGRDEFSALALSFNRMVEGLQEKEYIQNTFGRYIDAEIAKELLLRKESIQSGGKKGNVPILMADIRGFTTICEELSPAETLRWLNAYFSRMIKVIKENRGILIDFVGDAVLVFFDPFEAPLAEAVDRALRCAFDMQRQAEILNREAFAEQLPEVRIGIGINAGPVIIGNIGSEDRIKYGIVGSAVNVTQRIQEHARPGEIVVTPPVLTNAGNRVDVHRCFETRLKGIKEPVALCAIAPDEKSTEETAMMPHP